MIHPRVRRPTSFASPAPSVPSLLPRTSLPVQFAVPGIRPAYNFATLPLWPDGAAMAAQKNRNGLPKELQSRVERMAGIPLDDVRVHFNSPRSARFNALAYTQGREIHLGPGQERHLPHELWHVVQQRRDRVRPTMHMHGVPIAEDPTLEQEAEQMARRTRNDPGRSAAARGARSIAPHVSASPPASTMPAVQRVLNYESDKVSENLRASLAGTVKRFNDYKSKKPNSKEALHTQFRMIDQIERKVNRHLRNNSERISDDERNSLFALLGQTQEHHVDLTKRNLQQGHELWLRDTLPKKEQARRQGLWNSLVKGSGNIKVDDQKPAFRTRTLAGFSRLLQGAHGTDLVHELNRRQVSADRNVLISSDHASEYKKYHQEPKTGSFAAGIAKVRHNQDLHSRPAAGGTNVGTGSYVQINSPPPPTLEDHGTDVRGKPMFTPEFVTLGHELGHARQNLRGTTEAPVWSPGGTLAGQDLERELWTNPEEHRNINQDENPLRAEHDLPQRKYHANIKSARATRNKSHLVGRLDTLFNKVPQEHQPALGSHFGAINQDIQIGSDLSQPHVVNGLSGRIDDLQRNLSGTTGLINRERLKAGIKSALTPTKEKVGTAILGAGALWGAWNWWNSTT